MLESTTLRFPEGGRRNTPLWLMPLIMVLILGACQSETTDRSGFMSSYNGLTQDPNRPGARSYVNPAKGFEAYQAFLIEPVIVHFAPDADGTTVDPENLQMLSTFFQGSLIEALGQRYQIVRERGAGVLRVRVAITGVKEGNTVLNVLPQSKVLGLGLGGASMEAEAFDAMTGERIAAYMETAKGSQFSFEGLDSIDNAKQVIRVWVADFVARVDAAHGH